MKYSYQLASIGGEEAEVSEFPWTSLLLLRSSETNKTNRCGGTLISDRHVLTAGHCLRKLDIRGDIDDVWDALNDLLTQDNVNATSRNLFELGENSLKIILGISSM